MGHEWDRNKPKEGWATCARCRIEVKIYKIKKGGLPTCEQWLAMEQTKLDEIEGHAICMLSSYRPVVACFYCLGRFNARKCDDLRRKGGYYESLEAQKMQMLAIPA